MLISISGTGNALPVLVMVETSNRSTSTTRASAFKAHVVVIVLGDLGRSPRMQYHAASLLKEGHSVSMVGYDGVALIPALSVADDRLNVIRIRVPSPAILRSVLPLYLAWRVLSLCCYLFHALFIRLPGKSRNDRVDCVLVQNPPAMPLLAVAYIFCILKGAISGARPRLVIDWHNLGFTMLSNPFVSTLARAYEYWMAPLATAHLCVTNGMKDFLGARFRVQSDKIHVLYDCPSETFQPLSTGDQHRLLAAIHGKLCNACPMHWYENLDSSKQTLFTEIGADGRHQPRQGRPALVTSSTSWTPDEDFGLLLESLVILDKLISAEQSSLKVMVVVTGKGPLKEFYIQLISRTKLHNIAIQTLWLEPVDYPRLLACADLGVSLHTSTSGLDLPMKILDLYGCRVPVCARNFECLSELVRDDENGRHFQTSSELSQHLWTLLRRLGNNEMLHPHDFGDLLRYSRSLDSQTLWHENWVQNALPRLLQESE